LSTFLIWSMLLRTLLYEHEIVMLDEILNIVENIAENKLYFSVF